MSKRSHADSADILPAAKRVRSTAVDRLSSLSDELILRTFSYLTISELVLCYRLSHRLGALATDSQLWKSAYYDRFVRPRALRIPGLRDHDLFARSVNFSSKISRWLEDDHLVKGGRRTNWKRQYKLRHNWSRGSCNITETRVAERPSIPPLLVRLHENVVITVDATEGLRAWKLNGEQRVIATMPLDTQPVNDLKLAAPTSLALDTSNSDYTLGIAIGFANGKFGTYEFDRRKPGFTLRYMHAPSSNGTISAIAYASPYLLSMTDTCLLSFYRFSSETEKNIGEREQNTPRLLSSLKSHTAWPPLSLAIRVSPTNIFASIAYAMPTYLAGWSVGLQELLLTPAGSVLESRLASAQTQGFTPLSTSPSRSTSPKPRPDVSPSRGRQPEASQSSRPTSLSYTHPYLLATHADNTLTLYMVNSNADDLSIGPGHRLWGHTSSVSSAHVGDRGKAVSFSKHGNELRVWELEGGISFHTNRRRMVAGQASIQVRPEKAVSRADAERDSGNSGDSAAANREVRFENCNRELAITKGWVAFNEETVVVLRDQHEGSQSLVVYDFT